MKLAILAMFLTVATIVAEGPSRVAQGDVRVTCPMTTGGSYDVKTTALSGSVTPSEHHSPSFDGSFAVDLRTLDSGIDLRNDHLRGAYLEVDKAPEYQSATLSEIELKGMNPDAPEGKASFTGSLTLHGATKTVTGPVEVRKAGDGLRVKASFPINLSDYNISEPRYLGIGVKNTVQVEVNFTVAQ